MVPRQCFLFLLLLLTVFQTRAGARAQDEKSATIRVEATEDGQPVPARIRVRDAHGEPFIPPDFPAYRESFVCSGTAVFEATPGNYRIEVRRGTEYQVFSGKATATTGEETAVKAPLRRWIDMNSRGWYSGDLHAHRPLEVIPQMMLAADLNLCTVQTVWNNANLWEEKPLPDPLVQEVDERHVFHVLSEEDERHGGAILMFNLKTPIDLDTDSRAYPTSLGFIEQGHKQGAWIEQEKPFWWESPVNVALGGVRSTELANNHLCEEWIMDNEAWGRPRDAEKYPGMLGYALHCFDIYYHYLNTDFRLIPTAGSATGVLPNPLGYNRCYVDCGEDFSYERWFEGLEAGRNFVTNGPMLFVKAGGKGLGEALPADSGEILFSIEAQARTAIDRIEIVADGETIVSRILDAPSNRELWEPTVDLSERSWVVVRCFERAADTVRFAHTAPFYIEGRVSKKKPESARYFIEWIDDLIERLGKTKEGFETEAQRAEVKQDYLRARQVYEEIAGK
jgi:hypothetical protein